MKARHRHASLFLFICLVSLQFTPAPIDHYFEDIPASYSGIGFANNVKINVLYTVEFNDKVNPSIHYPYGSNSAGVGVGDFNNDGLTDIFFSSNAGTSKLYLNRGKFQFEDVSEKAGVTGNGTWGVGVSVADINGDGLLDIFVSHSGDFADPLKRVNELFINKGVVDGVPRFTESAKKYGLDLPGTQTTQVVFFDYDRDGDLDAFTLNHALQPFQVFRAADFYRRNVDQTHANHLLRNDQGYFTDVTREAKIIGTNLNFGLGVIVTDINNDGWPDIYSTSDFTESDFCYINQQDGSFKEVLKQSFPHIAAASMGVDAADFNNDGLIDLVSAEMKSKTNYRQKLTGTSDNEDDFNRTVTGGFNVQYGRNMLQMSQGIDKNGVPHFSEIGQYAGVYATEWSWGPLFADFDNDGWKDIFISAGFPDDLSLDKRNNFIASSKKDKTLVPGASKEFLDYLRTNSFFFRNNAKEGFSDVTDHWKPANLKMSYAAAYADFDNDGALDLVISNLNDVPTLLKNNHATKENNYFSISLKQDGLNRFAIGAKVFVESGGIRQMQELEPVRGYASSQDYNLHFGIGNGKTADITVQWPDGTTTTRKQEPANHFITIEKINTAAKTTNFPRAGNYAYTEVALTNRDSFISRQNDHPDFKYQFSMPYKVSDFGQVVATGDINGDGLEDYYIGGEAGIEKFFMLGNIQGQFVKYNPGCFELTDDNSASVLIDVDKDGDLDLVTESRKGKLQQPQTYYSDTSFTCRLYENMGKGKFTELPGAFSFVTGACKVMAAADYDNDGDIDLFVGGYNTPLNFGKKTTSYLLRNDSRVGKILFTDISREVLPVVNLGMVTSAEWKDMDNDHFPELLLATEWVPCKIFQNKKGRLADITAYAGLQKYKGLWSMIYPVDVNGDGYIDLVAGNVGTNNQFDVSPGHPMKLCMIDFDNNGKHSPTSIIPIVCRYEGEKEYPIYYRDEMLAAVQKMRPVFTDYESYATATLPEMIKMTNAVVDTVLECNTVESGVFINDGKGHFAFTAFPMFTQMSRINAAVQMVAGASREKTLLVAGNFFGYKMQLGRQDALPVVVLKNKKNGSFEAERPGITGLFSTGQVSKLFITAYHGKKRIIVFRKNEAPQIFEYNEL